MTTSDDSASAPCCTRCGAPLPHGLLPGRCPACTIAVTFGEEATDEEPQPGSREFAGYELAEEIGRGGMGVVYRAWQPKLKRSVALKLLLGGVFAGSDAVQRFRQEAEMAAGLHHPGIVPIYEAGEADGQAFYAMEWIEGRSLAELVRGQPLPPRQAAEYLQLVARAVHHAHGRGVLHRDLKPSNILIDAFDQPRVADFGLARPLEEASTLTKSTDVLGSPPYMSPEQALGKGRTAGVASDVYSLGAVLYHLLTGRPPFQGGSAAQILAQVEKEPPLPPRRVNPAVPRDLETICLKSLEKDAARRYPTAQALAEDLSAFLAGRPIAARPQSRTEKCVGWARQHPGVIAGLLLGAALTATLAVVILEAAVRTRVAAGVAEAAQREAALRQRQAWLHEASDRMRSSQSGRSFRTTELLVQAAEGRAVPEVTNLAVKAVSLPDLRKSRVAIRGEHGDHSDVSAGCGFGMLWRVNGTASLYRLSDGRELAQLSGLPPSRKHHPLLSPDGSCVVLREEGEPAPTLSLWRWADGAKVWSVAGWPLTDWNPDSRTLGILDATGRRRMIDAATGLPVTEWGRDLPGLREVPAWPRGRFSSDGQWLALPDSAAKAVWILHAATGAAERRLDWTGDLRAIAFAPDGKTLALYAGGRGTFWAWREGTMLPQSFSDGDGLLGMEFAPDGRHLATMGWGDYVSFFDTRLGAKIVSVRHGGMAAAFSPDGRRLGIVSQNDGWITLFEVWPGNGWQRVANLDASGNHRTEPRRRVGFDPSSRLLAMADGSGLAIWDADGRRQLGLWPTGKLRSLAFHPRLSGLALALESALLWLPMREDASGIVFGPMHVVQQERLAGPLAFNADGSRLAAVLTSRQSHRHGLQRLHLYDTASWSEICRTDAQFGEWRGPCFSPDGRFVADGIWQSRLLAVWDAATGQEVHRTADQNARADILWTNDGKLYWMGHAGEKLFVPQSAGAWTEAPVPQPDPAGWGDMATAAAFSPSGEFLAQAFPGGRLRIQHWPDRSVILDTVPDSTDTIWESLTFSRDGRRLALVDDSGDVVVWNVAATGGAIAERNVPLPASWPAQDPTAAGTVSPVAVDVMLGDPAAAVARCRNVREKLPARATDTPRRCVDLTDYFNEPVRGSFGLLPTGLTTLLGIPFDLRGMVRLAGEDSLTREPDLRGEVSGIRIGMTAPRLHFLHAAGQGARPGDEAGAYRLHFADGAILRVPLVVGAQLHVAWRGKDQSTPVQAGCQVAWRAFDHADLAKSVQQSTSVQLYRFTWENPKPNVEITALDFSSSMNPGAPFLVAITAEE